MLNDYRFSFEFVFFFIISLGLSERCFDNSSCI